MFRVMLARPFARSPRSRWIAAAAVVSLGIAVGPAIGAKDRNDHLVDVAEASLKDLARQISNPISPLWSVTLDQSLAGFDGGGVDDEFAYGATLEPVLPVRLNNLGLGRFAWSKDYHAVTGLDIPVVQVTPVAPGQGQGRGSHHKVGFGDVGLASLVAPATHFGVLWGVGPTFILPTASDNALGQGKWQAGPAVLGGYVAEHWTAYALAQQWWSFAGDGDRERTSQLCLNYVLLGHLPHGWQMGMQPSLEVDWTESSKNKVLFPVGLGFGKTIRIGSLPIQIWLEADYYAVRPDDQTAPRWGIDLQITPVLGRSH